MKYAACIVMVLLGVLVGIVGPIWGLVALIDALGPEGFWQVFATIIGSVFLIAGIMIPWAFVIMTLAIGLGLALVAWE